jgi:hypothetical protein
MNARKRSMTKTMNKRFLSALGKVFEAEIDGAYFQSKSKVYDELEADGCVERVSEKEGWPPLTVHYIRLTHRGRILYCESC